MENALQYLREIGMSFTVDAIGEKEVTIDVTKWGDFRFSKEVVYRIYRDNIFVGFGINGLRVNFIEGYPVTEMNTIDAV